MTRLQALAIAASILLVERSGFVATPQSGSPTQSLDASSFDQPQNSLQEKLQAATEEYEVRTAEFQAGRTPANVLVQANRRLLLASLVTQTPNAAIEYDRRASEIEAIARKNLELGTGTRQDVTQAKRARLDAMIKNLLVVPHSNNDQIQ